MYSCKVILKWFVDLLGKKYRKKFIKIMDFIIYLIVLEL